MKKLELVKAFKMEQENESLKAYKRMFPNAQPNIYQMELIEAYATDQEAWKQTLEYWAGNDYRPQSIQKMLDYYKQVLSGAQSFGRKVDVVGKPKLATYEPDPPCRYCGKEICFLDHREERLREVA